MALPWLGLGPAALTLVDVDSTTRRRARTLHSPVRDPAPALSPLTRQVLLLAAPDSRGGFLRCLALEGEAAG